MTGLESLCLGSFALWVAEGTCPYVICASPNVVRYIAASLGTNLYLVMLSEPLAFAGEGRASRSIPTASLGFCGRGHRSAPDPASRFVSTVRLYAFCCVLPICRKVVKSPFSPNSG